MKSTNRRIFELTIKEIMEKFDLPPGKLRNVHLDNVLSWQVADNKLILEVDE